MMFQVGKAEQFNTMYFKHLKWIWKGGSIHLDELKSKVVSSVIVLGSFHKNYIFFVHAV